MKPSRKAARSKLMSYLDIQVSLDHLDQNKDNGAYEQCLCKLKEIMDMLNAIPIGTREYNVVKLKYIERRNWVQIERELFLSERSCKQAASKGLDIIAAKFFSSE